jgi:hypothetical protein
MTPLQNVKLLNIVPPGAVNDNSLFTATAIDCRGFTFCRIDCLFGAMDIAMAGLKVQESDDDGSSDAYADVTGLVYGTSTDIGGSTSALPSATSDNKIFSFDIDLRPRKRYLKLVATAGDGAVGTYMAAVAALAGAENSPDTAAERNGTGGNVLRV